MRTKKLYLWFGRWRKGTLGLEGGVFSALKKRKPLRNKNRRNLASDQQKLGLNLPMGSESDRCAMYDG